MMQAEPFGGLQRESGDVLAEMNRRANNERPRPIETNMIHQKARRDRMEIRTGKRSNKRWRERGVYCQVEMAVLTRNSLMIVYFGEGGGRMKAIELLTAKFLWSIPITNNQ